MPEDPGNLKSITQGSLGRQFLTKLLSLAPFAIGEEGATISEQLRMSNAPSSEKETRRITKAERAKSLAELWQSLRTWNGEVSGAANGTINGERLLDKALEEDLRGR
jgi:hypothetical protein